MRQLFALSIFLLFGLPHTLWAGELKVIYGTRYGGESRNDYPVQLLELALEKSGRPYHLEAYEIPVTQSRAMLMLEQNKGISVYYAGTSAEFERNLAAVRIPLYRGLLGYRIFIINKATQPLFSRISSLTELAAMRAGQGTGWSDVEILRAAGLDVSEAPYESLLKMLQLRRIDYFPRGINEAFPETEQHVETFPSLHVEQDLLLVYPFALFFFVNKDNHALHDALYEGLVLAYQDGSFMELFESHPHVQQLIRRANLPGRVRMDVANPLMTPETATIPQKYWYQMK